MTKALLKRCRAVAAGRGEPGVVLLDGDHLLADALAAGVAIEVVLTSGRHPDLIRQLDAQGTPVVRVTDDVVSAASPVRTSSGLVALAHWNSGSIADVLAASTPVVIGLVGVQDPGNVGGIIRSAEALGASGLLALDDTADPAGWKALRGAMGSTFRLPIGRGRTTELFSIASRLGIPVAATVPLGGMIPARDRLVPPLIILFGGEGEGLTDDIVGRCDRRFTIPMRAGANSLNVGVSAALILWEARRASPLP
ncbi:MAG: RNA methyltransferase [Acidobacteriota bacterium]